MTTMKKKSSKQLQEAKDEFQRENAALQDKIDALKAENGQLKDKIGAMVERLSSNIDISLMGISTSVKPTDIPKEDLCAMVSTLALKGDPVDRSTTFEIRIEDLETRVTHQSLELVKLVHLKYNIETGLEDIMDCDLLEDVHSRANSLLLESKNLTLYLDSSEKPKPKNEQNDTNRDKMILSAEEQERQNKLAAERARFEKRMQHVDLKPPLRRYPGDTNVKHMHKGLKQCIINELSMYKGNGADWRLLAERCGFNEETVRSWQRMKLEFPMEQLFSVWENSAAATVRMLHRHLSSPQMKCTLLAKRISDFYQID